MKPLKNDHLGLYKPAFFSIEIARKNILNGSKEIKEEYHDVFFHEYIHYLQDILTTFGLRSIVHLIQQYSIINNEIINSEKPFFSIPYNSKSEVLLANKKLYDIYWGTDELSYEDVEFEVKSIERQENFDERISKEISFINVDIVYKDGLLTEDSFYLGAIHFMENIAALLEKRLFFNDHPSFPYRVIEKTIKQLYYDGDYSDSNLITFMESALKTYHPAEYLMQFYDFCNEKNLTFNESSIESFNKTYKIGWGPVKMPLEQFFYSNIAYTRNGFKILFNHERLSGLKDWGNILLNNSVKLNRANFSFKSLLNVNQNSKEQIEKTMYHLIKHLGTPIVSDGDQTTFMIAPKEGLEKHMIFLLGLEAIINVIDGDLKCTCIPYCKKNEEVDITNQYCYSSPWRRTEVEPLCIFAQLWIMWGFVKKDVVLE